MAFSNLTKTSLSIDMKNHQLIALAMIFAQTSAAPNMTWSSCPLFTFPDVEDDNANSAECTVYTAPLCHPGICETQDSADTTIDVFVKCLPATMRDPKKASNVWLLQGGPGYTPTACEFTLKMCVLQTMAEYLTLVCCIMYLLMFCSGHANA